MAAAPFFFPAAGHKQGQRDLANKNFFFSRGGPANVLTTTNFFFSRCTKKKEERGLYILQNNKIIYTHYRHRNSLFSFRI